jgi:hypothetical protein
MNFKIKTLILAGLMAAGFMSQNIEAKRHHRSHFNFSVNVGRPTVVYSYPYQTFYNGYHWYWTGAQWLIWNGCQWTPYCQPMYHQPVIYHRPKVQVGFGMNFGGFNFCF